MINITLHNKEAFTKFLEEYKDSIIELPINEIRLKENIHMMGIRGKSFQINAKKVHNKLQESGQEANGIIVVRKLRKDGYVLVSGLKWFRVAQLNKGNVKCIVVDSKVSHLNFNKKYNIIENSTRQPVDTDLYINYKNLVIEGMKKPKQEKQVSKFETYNKNKGIEKAVEVKKVSDDRYVLVDGYIRYLWLKERKERWIPVRVIE